MYQALVVVAGVASLALLFKLAGWSQYKDNAGTLAAAGLIIGATIFLLW